MKVPSLIPNKISSLRPSKRKIVKTIYTTEKFAKNMQKEMPSETKGIALYVSDACKNLRHRLCKQ